MISITKLLFGMNSDGDELRYSAARPASRNRPIVVWNCTRRCNLRCLHCYADAVSEGGVGELSTREATNMIEHMASFGVPVLLFSGGEPLMRRDLLELQECARSLGIRTVISTNGTLITKDAAKAIRKSGCSYVGVSLDGIGRNNDLFRGVDGAFELALSGIRNLVDAGQKVGLRFTMTRHNIGDLAEVMELVAREGLARACFYHLVYSGRGASISGNDLSREETRRCLDEICAWAGSLKERGLEKDILTVDNHADGAYLYLKAREKNPEAAEEIYRLLSINGGNRSGEAIAGVDELGFVHPDQFWHTQSLGNVRQRPFGDIWEGAEIAPLLSQLRDRKSLLKGRCGRCRFIGICNGNFRARAEAIYKDIWQEDPACYLTDTEIS